MKKKKKLKVKRRRHISAEQLFKKKKDSQLFEMNYLIAQAFPDPVDQKKYIEALIKGLEEEQLCENA